MTAIYNLELKPCNYWNQHVEDGHAYPKTHNTCISHHHRLVVCIAIQPVPSMSEQRERERERDFLDEEEHLLILVIFVILIILVIFVVLAIFDLFRLVTFEHFGFVCGGDLSWRN